MQAIEESDEVQLALLIGGRICNLEVDVAYSRFRGARSRCLYRGIMVIDANELRIGEGFGHQYRTGAMAAADIGRAASRAQFLSNALQRRQPVPQEVGVIAGTEESLGAVKQARVMLSPFHSLARAEVFHRALLDVEEILHDGVRPWKVDGTIRVGET